LVARGLYTLSPVASLMTKLVGATAVDTCLHTTIQRILQDRKRGHSVCVFPGGFVEAVGGTRTTQYIHTETYGYWLKQSREYNIPLRILHVYNGSAMYPQSDVQIHRRLGYAMQYGLPLVMPTGIRAVRKVLARTWTYEPTAREMVTVGAIEQDLFAYLERDRQHPWFEQGNSDNGFPTRYILTSRM